MPLTPKIPNEIVVHLGAPDSAAQNVALSFPDYIKNVASSEIYPTWPEDALRANILAQISVALNRVYTGYYRTRGYDFDITNSPAYDQTFVYQRDIYGNISRIVDEIFNNYIRRVGAIEPLFAQFCDGVEVQCPGLTQWGSVELANQGLDYFSILRRFYGDDIEIVTNAPFGDSPVTAEPPTLSEGDTGADVELLQRRLNRISSNYPAIPKIRPNDGYFGPQTTEAVREFQRVFGLEPDGIVGRATWNQVLFIYNAVKKLYEVTSEGLSIDDVLTDYTTELSRGAVGDGVRTVQYYLSYIALFVPSVISAGFDGSYGPTTESSVRSFQRAYGLPETGVVNRQTFDRLESVYRSMISNIEYRFSPGRILPFFGRVIGEGAEGDDVRALQEYLNYIAQTYSEIPRVTVDGVYGPATAEQVRAFKRIFGIPGDGVRVNAPLWNSIASIYDDLYTGSSPANYISAHNSFDDAELSSSLNGKNGLGGADRSFDQDMLTTMDHNELNEILICLMRHYGFHTNLRQGVFLQDEIKKALSDLSLVLGIEAASFSTTELIKRMKAERESILRAKKIFGEL